MKHLLFSGSASCGKSELVYRTVEWLTTQRGYKIIRTFHDMEYKTPRTDNCDMEVLIEKDGRHILAHSATDDSSCIARLKENLGKLAVENIEPDILLTTCRRPEDTARKELCDSMGWHIAGDAILDRKGETIPEIPLLRIRYENYDSANKWYKLHLGRLAQTILLNPPYSI